MTDVRAPEMVFSPDVVITGAPLTEIQVANMVDVRVQLVTNGVSEATLRFYDADFQLLDSITIGAPIEISFPQRYPSAAKQLVFSGEVMEVALDQAPNDLHELVVTAYDYGHRIGRSLQPTTHVDKTLADIASQIAGSVGLTADVTGFSTLVYPHLVQASDDRTFLTELAERQGASWRVVGKKLVIDAPPAPEFSTKWGEDLLRFTSRLSGAGASDEIEARGWDFVAKQPIVGQASSAAPDWSLNGGSDTARNSAYQTGGKRVLAGRAFDSQDEGTLLAKAVRARLDSWLAQARGEMWGNPEVVPGRLLTVDGVGQKFSGNYHLTTVEHVYSPSGFVTRFHAGPATPSGLADVLGGGSRHYGAMTGIISAHKDDPSGDFVRVKVQLPVLGDQVETTWARVVSAGAGRSRGLQITPDIGDEVVVIFENGDLQRPIVLGGVWNGQDQPPMPTTDTAANGVQVWHLKTRGGHKLTFDERDPSTKSVSIELSDGKTKLHLGANKVELWAAEDKPLELKSGQASITLNAGKIEIKGNTIDMTAQTSLKVESATGELKGSASLKIEAPSVKVAGGGAVEIEASGMASLKGAIVQIN